jgi:hypothetical protein
MNNLFYVSENHWSPERPKSLVVCCSDGRLQKSTDEFLQNHLGIVYYDRLYAPGGPAALADSSGEYMRSNLFRSDMKFLFDAHAFSQVILIFHGAADGGPTDGVCAHYRRLMPGRSNAEIAQRQEIDKADVLRHLAVVASHLDILVYRAEVLPDLRIKFVELG